MELNVTDQATNKLSWPSPQDFSEAVQAPVESFADPELREGKARTNKLGLPICMSGNFASVFSFECATRRAAVRCFLHDVPDQEERYSAISNYVCADSLECTVPFEYLEKGVRIHGEWYPILKMEWVDGITLNQFVTDNLSNGLAIKLLSGYFKDMVMDMQAAGIAHGDLQHDNILISDGCLRLVDYDGLYVPALKGMMANELGHSNYQHPLRAAEHFGPGLDNFSAWIIFLSLRAISLDPSLMEQLQGGADCILLRRSDLTAPQQSKALALLSRHSNEKIRNYAAIIRHLLELPVMNIPPINTPLAQFWQGSLDQPMATDPKASPAPGALPDWIQQPAAESLKAEVATVPTDTTAVAIPGSDPLYPQFNLIDLPAQDYAITPLVTKNLVAQHLLAGEAIQWVGTKSAPGSIGLNPGQYKSSLGLGIVVTFMLAFCNLSYIIPCLIGLSIVVIIMFIALTAEHQVLAILTNKRLILVTRKISDLTLPIVRSYPRDEITGASGLGSGDVTLFARTTFKVSASAECLTLKIAADEQEAEELRRQLGANNASALTYNP